MLERARIVERFQRVFRGTPRVFSAPGRVNLIGEHTDYNEGFVLPVAIERRTYVAASPRTDRSLCVHSADLDESRLIHLDQRGARSGTWLDYVEGTARALEDRGVLLPGADMLVTSDVPRGAGLSSSAALELSVAFALAKLAGDGEQDRMLLALSGGSRFCQNGSRFCPQRTPNERSENSMPSPDPLGLATVRHESLEEEDAHVGRRSSTSGRGFAPDERYEAALAPLASFTRQKSFAFPAMKRPVQFKDYVEIKEPLFFQFSLVPIRQRSRSAQCRRLISLRFEDRARGSPSWS